MIRLTFFFWLKASNWAKQNAWSTRAGILSLFLLTAWVTSIQAGVWPTREIPSLAPMLAPILPAVVNISTRSRVQVRESPLLQDPFFRHFFNLPDRPRERISKSLGSGVVIDAARGYVITNHHVIDKADEITVTLHDGRVLQARPVGADSDTDIAVIQVTSERLTAIPLGDSERLRVGDFVVAIGNPFGLGQTATSGIVSALGRSGLGIEGYEDFIQTDASINPGNSGGALVDINGELIGINTAILAPNGGNVGIGFAIPINLVKQVVTQLTSYGRMRRGTLGIQLQDVTPELAAAFNISVSGAVVAKVTKGSPADQSGIKVGDVITGINGRTVNSGRDLRNSFGVLTVGAKATLTVVREGHPLQLTVKIAEPHRDTLEGEKIDPRLQGSTLSSLDPDSPLYGEQEGVLVSKVRPNSMASRLGLQDNDLLISINRLSIKDLEDIRHLGKTEGKALLIHLRRGDNLFQILAK